MKQEKNKFIRPNKDYYIRFLWNRNNESEITITLGTGYFNILKKDNKTTLTLPPNGFKRESNKYKKSTGITAKTKTDSSIDTLINESTKKINEAKQLRKNNPTLTNHLDNLIWELNSKLNQWKKVHAEATQDDDQEVIKAKIYTVVAFDNLKSEIQYIKQKLKINAPKIYTPTPPTAAPAHDKEVFHSSYVDTRAIVIDCSGSKPKDSKSIIILEIKNHEDNRREYTIKIPLNNQSICGSIPHSEYIKKDVPIQVNDLAVIARVFLLAKMHTLRTQLRSALCRYDSQCNT